MAYFAVHDLGLSFQQALFVEPASRIMLLLNQNALVNIGDEHCMTLTDLEQLEKMKGLKHG